MLKREPHDGQRTGTHSFDIVFLQELIHELEPKRFLEIGTASGTSTGFIAMFMEDSGGVLASIDTEKQFYGDRSRETGFLLRQIYRGQTVEVDLLQGDASLPVLDAHAKYDCAFIDANHNHPCPTLDTLAVLPILQPAAPVIHHDLGLFRTVEYGHVIGPKVLFDQLPRELTRVDEEGGNIFSFAVEDRTAVTACFEDSLLLPWSSEHNVSTQTVSTWRGLIEEHWGERVLSAFDEAVRRYCKQPVVVTHQPQAAPAMLTESEQGYIIECAAKSGLEGEVVDLGCWMGGTAIALAKGLSRRPLSYPVETRVKAFDVFIWQEWMNVMADHVWGQYEPGDTFLPEARRYMDPYREWIDIVEADLMKYKWTGAPIGLMVVDAMKSWQLTASIAQSFYPHLAPGALVIHQDFKHYSIPWIHLLQYRARDSFRVADDVPASTTVAVEVVRPISPEEIRQAIDFSSVQVEEMEEAFWYCASLVQNDDRGGIAGSHVMFFVMKGDHEGAMRAADWLVKAGVDQSNSQFQAALKQVTAMNGERCAMNGVRS